MNFEQFQPRMVKNKHIHNSVNKQIAEEKEQIIRKYHQEEFINRLSFIDAEYFNKMIRQFDIDNEIQKPYIDLDKRKENFPYDLKYYFRNLYNDLSQTQDKFDIEALNRNDLFFEDKKSGVVSEKYKKYLSQLIFETNSFDRQLNDIKAKRLTTSQIVKSDISKATVTLWRNNDSRKINDMFSEASKNTEALRAKLGKHNTIKKDFYRMKYIVWLLPLLFAVMLAIILVLVFI